MLGLKREGKKNIFLVQDNPTQKHRTKKKKKIHLYLACIVFLNSQETKMRTKIQEKCYFFFCNLVCGRDGDGDYLCL